MFVYIIWINYKKYLSTKKTKKYIWKWILIIHELKEKNQIRKVERKRREGSFVPSCWMTLTRPHFVQQYSIFLSFVPISSGVSSLFQDLSSKAPIFVCPLGGGDLKKLGSIVVKNCRYFFAHSTAVTLWIFNKATNNCDVHPSSLKKNEKIIGISELCWDEAAIKTREKITPFHSLRAKGSGGNSAHSQACVLCGCSMMA